MAQPKQLNLTWDKELDFGGGDIADIEARQKRARDELSAIMSDFVRTPGGKRFAKYLQNVIAGRTYIPGETDFPTVSFVEGTRYLALEIAELSNLNAIGGN